MIEDMKDICKMIAIGFICISLFFIIGIVIMLFLEINFYLIRLDIFIIDLIMFIFYLIIFCAFIGFMLIEVTKIN